MNKNEFIDKSIQKAFVPGVSGCLEHNQLMWETLKYAKKEQLAICISWLDLANAYGSIRHNLIHFAMKYYHIPQEYQTLVFNYYDNLIARVTTDDWSTDWYRYEIGVFQGCTLSTILFNIVFNLLYEWLKNCDVKPFMLGKEIPIREKMFADDLAIVTSRPLENQQMINHVDDFLDWTKCMIAKPAKCLSIAYTQFKPGCKHKYTPVDGLVYSSFDPLLQIAGKSLTFLKNLEGKEIFMKFLGFKIYPEINLKEQKLQLQGLLLTYLEKTDKESLSGMAKCFIYNSGILPRLSWYFLIYEFSISFIESLQKKVDFYIKKWAKISPRGVNTAIFYLNKKKKGFGILNLVHAFQNYGLVREHILKYSKDPDIRLLAKRRLDAAVENKQLKWTAPIAVRDAERGVALDAIAAGQTNKQGVGYGAKVMTVAPKVGTREHREAISMWLKERNADSLLVDLHRLTIQQDWTQWKGIMDQDLSWQKLIYRMSESDVKFYIQGTLQIAPTPAYLNRLGYIKGQVKCPLCDGNGCALQHVLSSCPFSLDNGRYTWRHNEVLKIIHYKIGIFIRKMTPDKVKKKPTKKMMFVKEGEKPPTNSAKATCLLEQADDWKIIVDLPGCAYDFPANIVITEKRPDLVVWSENIKIIIIMELTVPAERNVFTAHEKKEEKYESLHNECTKAGYEVCRYSVEVGALGYVANSMWAALKELGVWSKQLKDDLSEMALRCSYKIFVSHKKKEWVNWKMFRPK